jgi:hypothetical protein
VDKKIKLCLHGKKKKKNHSAITFGSICPHLRYRTVKIGHFCPHQGGGWAVPVITFSWPIVQASEDPRLLCNPKKKKKKNRQMDLGTS